MKLMSYVRRGMTKENSCKSVFGFIQNLFCISLTGFHDFCCSPNPEKIVNNEHGCSSIALRNASKYTELETNGG
jgi:hypothetical protein